MDIRFLENDEEYQHYDDGRFSWFHFTDPDGTFKPLTVRGHGPIMISNFPDMLPEEYAIAILDYHHD